MQSLLAELVELDLPGQVLPQHLLDHVGDVRPELVLVHVLPVVVVALILLWGPGEEHGQVVLQDHKGLLHLLQDTHHGEVVLHIAFGISVKKNQWLMSVVSTY